MGWEPILYKCAGYLVLLGAAAAAANATRASETSFPRGEKLFIQLLLGKLAARLHQRISQLFALPRFNRNAGNKNDRKQQKNNQTFFQNTSGLS